MVERLFRNVEVSGSIPLGSTKSIFPELLVSSSRQYEQSETARNSEAPSEPYSFRSWLKRPAHLGTVMALTVMAVITTLWCPTTATRASTGARGRTMEVTMKKLFISLLFICMVAPFLSLDAQVSVKGHYRSNGTYVQPHYRSSPNSTKADNWSTRGNVNPYTGRAGTSSHDSPSFGSRSSGFGTTQRRSQGSFDPFKRR